MVTAVICARRRLLGTFAIAYREVRSPSDEDLQLIENAGHIAGIAIERHLSAERLRHERDRLRLLLEITNSMTSKLDFRRLAEALSQVCSAPRALISALCYCRRPG